MVHCSDFLQGYSEFRDGALDAARRRDFSDHLAVCGSCARYDRVVREGADVWRSLPRIEPSEDFAARLQHRIFHVEDELALRGGSSSGASVLVTLSIAFAIGLTAWTPVARPRTPVVELPPVVAHAPHRVEATQVLFRPGPLLQREPVQSVPVAGPRSSPLYQFSPLWSPTETPVHPALRVP